MEGPGMAGMSLGLELLAVALAQLAAPTNGAGSGRVGSSSPNEPASLRAASASASAPSCRKARLRSQEASASGALARTVCNWCPGLGGPARARSRARARSLRVTGGPGVVGRLRPMVSRGPAARSRSPPAGSFRASSILPSRCVRPRARQCGMLGQAAGGLWPRRGTDRPPDTRGSAHRGSPDDPDSPAALAPRPRRRPGGCPCGTGRRPGGRSRRPS